MHWDQFIRWYHLGTKTPAFMIGFSMPSGVRTIESSGFMERAMGIEPTSEAKEACCRRLKTHKLAAFCRFSTFSNGFQLEQPDTTLRLTAEECKI